MSKVVLKIYEKEWELLQMVFIEAIDAQYSGSEMAIKRENQIERLFNLLKKRVERDLNKNP